MRKRINFYLILHRDRLEFATIDVELRTDEKGREVLSMMGTFAGSAGQCYNEIMSAYSAVPKQKKFELLSRLCTIWKRWHLNDMRAGTPRQMDALREAEKRGFKGDYTKQLEYLKSCGLDVDNGYTYGSKWLYEPLPKDVLVFIKQLLGIPVEDKVTAKEHISFTRQGTGGYYVSSLKSKEGNPKYTIYKVQEGWAVRIFKDGRNLAWISPRNAIGFNAKTGCFDTLNNARTAVNL